MIAANDIISALARTAKKLADIGYIVGDDVEERLRSVMNEITDLLQTADSKDAAVHGYEHFLTTYNPNLRKSHGVFYTPQPVVKYIVRAVDEILRQEFNLQNGIADNTKMESDGKKFHRVQILDSAVGTGIFFAEVVRQIYKIVTKNGRERWNDYAANDLLPRLHGFEILMTPYIIAHWMLTMILEDTGYRFENDQRIGIYLTNALDEGINKIDRLPFATWLSDEAEGANRVKKDMPMMVVIGNPPYNNFMGTVSHFNETVYAKSLIEQYKKGLGEKKINIDDDYIKFIALGQSFIEKNANNCGVLAYISNNSFLDGITHRQMRKVLLETFDKIYILNLHGNARKKETAPDGSKDENVFNIMQGNSINIFIKKPPAARRGSAVARSDSKGKPAKVFHVDLYGKRQEKYDFLLKHRLKKSGYVPLEPIEPYYFFVPKDFSLQKKYDGGFAVSELFIEYNSGIKTDRDDLFIDHDKDILAKRMKKLLSGDYDWRFEDKFRIVDSSSYKLTQVIKNKKYEEKHLQKIVYRPFDNRWIYYDPTIISRPAQKVMQHIVNKDNLGLIVSRQVKLEKWNHVCAANSIVECCVNFCGAGMPIVAPLYIYPPQEDRRPNLNSAIVAKIEQIIDRKVKPEKLFDYVYAVLYSPKYRKDYVEFLKIDFPRIPYPTDNAEFERFAKFGQRLRELHLLEKMPKIKTTFPVADGNEVSEIRYENQRIYINKVQFFGNVPPAAWTFFIGGYQPLQKYLKDRKGRTLTFDEIQHYQKIVAVLGETILIQNELGEGAT